MADWVPNKPRSRKLAARRAQAVSYSDEDLTVMARLAELEAEELAGADSDGDDNDAINTPATAFPTTAEHTRPHGSQLRTDQPVSDRLFAPNSQTSLDAAVTEFLAPSDNTLVGGIATRAGMPMPFSGVVAERDMGAHRGSHAPPSADDIGRTAHKRVSRWKQARQ